MNILIGLILVISLAGLGFVAAGINAITLGLIAVALLVLMFLGSSEKDTALLIGAVFVIIVLGLAFLFFPIDITRIIYLVIFVIGAFTTAFFFRLREFEVPGVFNAGILIGLLLMIIGVYFMLA